MKQFWICLMTASLVLAASLALSAQQGQRNRIVQIRFVDSDHKQIPYFTGLHRNLGLHNKQEELSALFPFIKGCIAEDLLPINSVGSGIDTTKNSNKDAFDDEIDLDGLIRVETLSRDDSFNKRIGRSWETLSIISYVFPDGTAYQLTREDLEKLGHGQHEVVITGHLGSGEWAELGHFLVDAAFYWRWDRGSQSTLLKRCDALIARYRERGNLEWAGNLTFVRGLWLRGDFQRVGLFGKRPSTVTAEEWKELPYGSKGYFGHAQAIPFGQPIEPYRAFKKVMEVNPKDPRAIYWVKVLPWLSGAKEDSVESTASYLKSARKIYEIYRDQLDDQHKVKALDTFFEAASSYVYVQRYWKKRTDAKVDAEIEWAVNESEFLVKKYPFLRNDFALRWTKNIAYMKAPNRVLP